MNTITTSIRAAKHRSEKQKPKQDQSNNAGQGNPSPKDWWKDPSHRAGKFDLKKLFNGATWHPAQGLPPGIPVRVFPAIRTSSEKARAALKEAGYLQIAPGLLRPLANCSIAQIRASRSK